MKIKILTKKHNPLLKRREISFEVKHDDEGNTPSRLDLKNNLANMLKTKSDLLYVKRVETRTGTTIALGEAHAYESSNQAILVEPEHIVTRNSHRAAESVDEPKMRGNQQEKIKAANKPSKSGMATEEDGDEPSPPVDLQEEDHDE